MPFLQEVLGDFDIIPTFCGQAYPFILADMLTPNADKSLPVLAQKGLPLYNGCSKAWMKPAAMLQRKPCCTLTGTELEKKTF